MVHVLETLSPTSSQPKISSNDCITQFLTWLGILATWLSSLKTQSYRSSFGISNGLSGTCNDWKPLDSCSPECKTYYENYLDLFMGKPQFSYQLHVSPFSS